MKNLICNSILMLVLCFASNVAIAQDAMMMDNEKMEKAETDNTKESLLKKYPWVKSHMQNTALNQLEIMEMKSENNAEYIVIKTDKDKIMYDKDGNKYCTDSSTLDCKEFYKLSPGDLTWRRS